MSAAADLVVMMSGVRAGLLRCDARGRLQFAYDADYMSHTAAVPLSVSLPFSDRPFGDRPVGSWVASLLPDDPAVLAGWYERERVPQRTPFGLLSTRVGHDCAGAVQFCPVGREADVSSRASGLIRLSGAALRAEVAEITRDPTMWTPADVEPYFSLGGYQTKMALHRVDGGWARPFGDVPTTHILKPRPRSGELAAIGEHLCLGAARRLGLDAADSWLECRGPHVVAVVVRYDRWHDDGRWHRIHQEDMCQALGLPGSRKHERHGGPGMSQVGDIVRDHSTAPDEDIAKLADAVLYAWLTVNRDAHARNYSLLHKPLGETRLAPLYDLNSSLMFTSKKIGSMEMAMRYAGGFTVYSASSEEALPAVAGRLGIRVVKLLARAEELADGLLPAMEAEISELPEAVQRPEAAQQFLDRLARRVSACNKAISSSWKHIGKSPQQHRRSSHAVPPPIAAVPATICPERVKSTQMPCLLPSGHRGHCRGR